MLNISKLILTVAITLLTIVDLVMAISGTDVAPALFYTPVVKIASFVSSSEFSMNLNLLSISF